MELRNLAKEIALADSKLVIFSGIFGHF